MLHSFCVVDIDLKNPPLGYRSAMSVQSSLVMHPLNAFAKPELKERLIPQLAKGELVGCFGLTEPDFGSDPAGMATEAKEGKNGSFVISGAKTWISNSPFASVRILIPLCCCKHFAHNSTTLVAARFLLFGRNVSGMERFGVSYLRK